MDVALATAILNTAKEAGFFEGDLPEDEAEIIGQGEYFLQTATNAHGQGMQMPAVLAIMRLGGWTGDDDSDVSSSVEEGTPSDPETPAAEVVEPKEQGQPEPSAEQTKIINSEHLPVPPGIEGEALPMPRDLTTSSDREIRRLHSEYNAFLARVTYLVSLAVADVRNSSALRDAEYRTELLRIKHEAEDGDLKKTMSQAQEEALATSGVVEWDALVRKHENDLEMLKALKEVYKGNVDRLSREMTMRADEFARSGGGR